jgi:5-formyltetrahydrofolate cyclo-ligase
MSGQVAAKLWVRGQFDSGVGCGRSFVLGVWANVRRELDEAGEQALRVRAKAELRERLRAVRRVLPEAACATRSQALCERLIALPEFASARVVVGYAAYRKEADAQLALHAAEQAGKNTGLVRVEPENALGVHRHRSGDALAENAYGILEPAPDAPRIELGDIDLILVPGLAVDERGHRIGYGQGYYDRLLPRLPRAFKVAVAYDFQLLAETPNTHADVAVDCVVTDERVLRVVAAPRT